MLKSFIDALMSVEADAPVWRGATLPGVHQLHRPGAHIGATDHPAATSWSPLLAA